MVDRDRERRTAPDVAAGDWLARLDRDEVSDEVRAAFEHWRASDPRHAAAYARLEATWGQLDRVQALRPAGTAGEAPDFFDHYVVAAHETKARFGGDIAHRYRWAVAAAILLAVATALVVAPYLQSPMYSTGIGGFQRVVLEDGSVMELNTDTLARLRFSGAIRKVELQRGEANFKVVHDAARPFVVTAGETAVRALGTRFNVRRGSQTVEVIVTEGKVAVGATTAVERASSSALPPSASVLVAGQSALAGSDGLQLRDVSADQGARKLSWRGGMLAFEGDSLQDVVAELNRYNERQLFIGDEQTAAFKVGGYFTPTNLEAFVDVLEAKFGVRAEARGGSIVLRAADRLPEISAGD